MTTGRHTTRHALVALTAIAAITMAACGSDSDSSSTTAAPTTAAAAPTTAAPRPRPPAGRAPPQPTARRRRRRRSTSTPPSDGQYGLIDGVYKGAGDFVIDPADCPADWDPKQGITDTEIDLFISLPTSGPLAGFGLLADGMQSRTSSTSTTTAASTVARSSSTPRTTATSRTRPRPTSTRRSARTSTPRSYAIARHAEQPGRSGTRPTTSACRSCSTAPAPPQWGDVENHPWTIGHAARLLHRGQPVGQVAGDRAPRADEGRRDHVQQRLRPELPQRLRLRHQGHRHRGRRPADPRADRTEPGQPVHHAGRVRRRRAADRDLRRVLHAGDGRRREADDAGSRW